jgi:ketosteroid isomerase-like protein
LAGQGAARRRHRFTLPQEQAPMGMKSRSRARKPKWDPALVKAHKAYVSAINSNNTDRVMKMYDKDAVVMQPDGPLVQGRGPLRKWVADYFKAYKTHWVKVSKVMWVAGDYGFDQGHDTAVDKPILRRNPTKYGKPIKQNVKGILIYKRQRDGRFLVYRDIWNSNVVPKS